MGCGGWMTDGGESAAIQVARVVRKGKTGPSCPANTG